MDKNKKYSPPKVPGPGKPNIRRGGKFNMINQALKALGPMMLARYVMQNNSLDINNVKDSIVNSEQFQQIKGFGKRLMDKGTEIQAKSNKTYLKSDAPNNPGMSNKIYKNPPKAKPNILDVAPKDSKPYTNQPMVNDNMVEVVGEDDGRYRPENEMQAIFEEITATDINSVEDMETKPLRRKRNKTNIVY